MRKPALYIICGLPFSGKTTLARALADQYGFVHLDLDARAREKSLFPEEGIDDEQWGHIFGEAYQQIAVLLNSGQSVVVDAVNYDRAGRERLRTIARQRGNPACVIYINLSIQEIERRRQANQTDPQRPTVRDEDLMELATGFEPPTLEENLLIYDGIQSTAEWIKHHIGGGS